MRQSWPVVLRDALLVILVAAAAALGSNRLRSRGRLPLVATSEYEVVVPCPESKGSAEPVEASALSAGAPGLVLIDARDAQAFARWHAAGALSVPFDYLEPTSGDVIRRVLRTRGRRVVVYGDGASPDTGEQLARELAGKGVRNVGFVRGGAPALQRGRP